MPRITNIEIIQQVEQNTISMRKKVKLEELPVHIGSCFAKMGAYLQELGELLTDIPVAIFYSYRQMTEEEIDLELALPLSKKVEGKGDIKAGVIPASKLVFSLYQGNQDGMISIYKEIEEWIAAKGLEPIGSCYEYYYNGEEYGEDKLLTKVVIPVK